MQRTDRKSNRLKNCDYSNSGFYFITICSKNHACIFGRIIDGNIHKNTYGTLLEERWVALPKHHPCVSLDDFVIMPNHFHGILIIDSGTAGRAPTLERFGKPVSCSIPTIIRSFKASVSRQINIIHPLSQRIIWQRGYWDRVIRNEKELNTVREYIQNNPRKWELDTLHPKNV